MRTQTVTANSIRKNANLSTRNITPKNADEMTEALFSKLQTDEPISMKDMVKAELALADAKEAAGIVEEDAPPTSLLGRFAEWRITKAENRIRHDVNRKKYIRFAALGGWFGLHQYYAKRYYLAVFYTLFFWTGVPLASTLIDLMIAIPMAPDEGGCIAL